MDCFDFPDRKPLGLFANHAQGRSARAEKPVPESCLTEQPVRVDRKRRILNSGRKCGHDFFMIFGLL